MCAVNDTNQHRLVKSKMVNIFKPNVRQALLRDISGSTRGIFGGDLRAFKNLEDSKKQSALLKMVMLQIKKPGRQVKLAQKEARSLQPKGDPRARVRKALRRSPKREPRRTLMTPRRRRSHRRQTTSPMIHVS